VSNVIPGLDLNDWISKMSEKFRYHDRYSPFSCGHGQAVSCEMASHERLWGSEVGHLSRQQSQRDRRESVVENCVIEYLRSTSHSKSETEYALYLNMT